MKRICIFLALAILLGCLTGCSALATNSTSGLFPGNGGRKEPSATEAHATYPTEATPPATEIAADALPDFTVTTIQGDTYRLYDEVKTHDLVLINLFATWCGPCKMEFPYLEEAWERERARVSVIALSVEPTDTLDVLRDFADEYGLNFSVGRESGADLSRFVTGGIPTTLIVDRTGRVAAVEVGAKSSTEAFLDLFDNYSGANYDPNRCTYSVGAYDINTYELVAGVVVNFCTDTVCTPVVTTDDNVVDFTGTPAEYHVQIVSLPEGWAAVGETDFYTETYGQTFWIPLQSIG